MTTYGARALTTLMPAGHNVGMACNMCHQAGSIAPAFNQIHTGYNKLIYANADGDKYADLFVGTVDSASLANNILTVTFSVTEDAASNVALNPTDIVPTVMISLYGYDTKDFIVSAHGRDAARNRFLEIVVGAVDTEENGETNDYVVALNAQFRTFDLVANDFADDFYPDIVDVENGCNDCHGALGTTFHSGDRGGNMKMCRQCHVPENGGSHLEMQSRSIDSCAHAIHSFQPFDTGDIDMTDPVAKMRYQHHVESTYPNFTITNCQSCHVPGAYNVPDQSKSRTSPGLGSQTSPRPSRSVSRWSGFFLAGQLSQASPRPSRSTSR